jgi:two-component system cell cycle sensor histidine kinase/response regulator CckA
MSSPTIANWCGSGTVLLADDEAAPRNVMGRLLTAIGFECVCTSNGEEAFQHFREDPDRFRLAVLDVVMPVCDGPKCLHQLRRLRPGLPALFISGYDDESLKVELADTSTAFLQKPFHMRDLREQLRLLLAGPPPGGHTSVLEST